MKVIAADFYDSFYLNIVKFHLPTHIPLTVSIKILLNFTQVRRAVLFDHEARIRERRGALLFALDEESAVKVNRSRFLHLPFFCDLVKS